jgi:hypothetical protein
MYSHKPHNMLCTRARALSVDHARVGQFPFGHTPEALIAAHGHAVASGELFEGTAKGMLEPRAQDGVEVHAQ